MRDQLMDDIQGNRPKLYLTREERKAVREIGRPQLQDDVAFSMSERYDNTVWVKKPKYNAVSRFED